MRCTVEIQLVTRCQPSSDTPPCHISGVNMLQQLCLLVAIALVDSCEYNGTKHINGEKWVRLYVNLIFNTILFQILKKKLFFSI